jgi:hypothetical protein
MDFAKFVDLLENSRLWFARADLLEDPREGDLTEAEVSQIRRAASAEVAEVNITGFRKLRRENFVNCWTTSSESMAMWDLYARGPVGVAIKSKVGSIKRAIESAQDKIFLAFVEYLDWKTEARWRNNIFSQYVRKDFGFAHEKEVRMIIWQAGSSMPTDLEVGDLVRLHNFIRPLLVERTTAERNAWKKMYEAAWDEASRKRAKPGLAVPINVAELIEEIVVSPRSKRERNLVERIVCQRYGFQSKLVCSSSLSYGYEPVA